jgi:polyphosphate kinase 2 (PPK2 family)
MSSWQFFLYLSKEEQGKRLLERIDQPEKNWRFNEADITERQFRPQYQRAYEDCLHATSTTTAPWHVVPADDKLNARLITRARRRELRAIRERLVT